MRFRRCAALLLIVFSFPAAAESREALPDPASLVGLSLEGLYARFGVPQAAYAVRGGGEWQDDVVLVYDAGDFYILKDRVWQVGLKSACGVGIGDTREAALLALGGAVVERGGRLFLSLPGKGWPLMFRADLDSSGLVSALFVYRSDF
jgi:hypothetical protein